MSDETMAITSNGAVRPRQPGGLWTLSSLELWERFSFYGLQVILAYYIYYSAAEGGLGLSEAEAFAISGAYGGAVYLGQPAGAWLADRVVPMRSLVFAGGAIIMCGHITLAFVPGLLGLLLGLIFIVIGTSTLYPNVLAIMNLLYEGHSPKREFGFALYYAAILIGALFGPIVTGFLQITYGFHVGFSAAALGMLIGLLTYTLGRKTLPHAAKIVPNPVGTKSAIRVILLTVIVIGVVAVLIVTKMITVANFNYYILATIAVVSVAYFFVIYQSKDVELPERRRIIAYIPLFVVTIVFWTLILQLFTTFAYYADTRVDLSLGAIRLPAAYISTFEVATAIIVGPLIARWGQRLAVRNPRKSVAPMTKLTISFGIMAFTFLIFTSLSWAFGDLIPLLAVIVGMIFFGVAENTYAPIFLSSTGRLAPKKFNAQMMALSGLTLAAGASLSGFAGQLYLVMEESSFFVLMTAIGIICCGVLFFSRKPMAAVGLD